MQRKRIIFYTYLFFLIALLLFTISCTKKNTVYLEDSFAIVYENNKPYLIDKNQKTYDLSYYDQVIDIFNDYIGVKKNNKFGYIDLTGKLVIPTEYDAIYPMYENKAVVIKKGQFLIINNKNEVLYTFSNNLYSESYFSEDHLVVTDGEKYGYLTYDNGNFNITELSFDAAKPFKNNYAVVGKKEEIITYKLNADGELTDEIESITYSENLKYYHIDKEFKCPYQDKLASINGPFDFADDFYDGYARVANMSSIPYSTVGQLVTNLNYIDGLLYKYIQVDGTEFHFNYAYHRTIILNDRWHSGIVDEDVLEDGLVEFPYATNFHDGFCITAKFEYLPTNNQFIKEYMFIRTDGYMPFVEAIYFAPTSYRFGYDIPYSTGYRTQSSGQFWPSTINKIDDIYCFSVGNTLNNSYFKIKFTTLEYDKAENLDEAKKYSRFSDVRWVHPYLNPDSPASWAKEFNEKYLKNASNFILLQNFLELPYEMNEVSYSKHFSDTTPIVKSRITYSDAYGLIVLSTDKAHNNTHDIDYTIVKAQYLLPPIYQKIVY